MGETQAGADGETEKREKQSRRRGKPVGKYIPRERRPPLHRQTGAERGSMKAFDEWLMADVQIISSRMGLPIVHGLSMKLQPQGPGPSQTHRKHVEKPIIANPKSTMQRSWRQEGWKRGRGRMTR